jgi:hypothetical protein
MTHDELNEVDGNPVTVSLTVVRNISQKIYGARFCLQDHDIKSLIPKASRQLDGRGWTRGAQKGNSCTSIRS